jgi:hypothetical protein
MVRAFPFGVEAPKADQNRTKSGIRVKYGSTRPILRSKSKHDVARTVQQNEWQLLGRGLRDLRESLDLGQKVVIDLSGEAMNERTLRAYESGEKRPSRDRLLKLMIKSFEIKACAEINRFLRLGRYGALTHSEAVRYGIDPSTPNGPPSIGSPGAPMDFRVEVSTLIVVDGQGRELWRHQFPSRLLPAAYEDREAVRKCTFEDLDGNGRLETLFVHVPLDLGSVGAKLVCFAEDGSIKWEFVPGRTVSDTTGRVYTPPYFISNVQIIPMPDSLPRVLVSSNHYLHNPNQIAMLDSDGVMVSEYWHSGHLLSVAHADLNGDGVQEILLAGVNNGFRQATMVIFDSRNVCGCSSQPGRQILDLPAGTEKAVVLFPRTCVSKEASYNRVVEMIVTRERRIMLAVAEGVSESKNPGVMIYELDFQLNVLNARPDSHLQESHRQLEIEGVLDHPWTDEEHADLRHRVIVTLRP